MRAAQESRLWEWQGWVVRRMVVCGQSARLTFQELIALPWPMFVRHMNGPASSWCLVLLNRAFGAVAHCLYRLRLNAAVSMELGMAQGGAGRGSRDWCSREHVW
jgi:hypothetical protein